MSKVCCILIMGTFSVRYGRWKGKLICWRAVNKQSIIDIHSWFKVVVVLCTLVILVVCMDTNYLLLPLVIFVSDADRWLTSGSEVGYLATSRVNLFHFKNSAIINRSVPLLSSPHRYLLTRLFTEFYLRLVIIINGIVIHDSLSKSMTKDQSLKFLSSKTIARYGYCSCSKS